MTNKYGKKNGNQTGKKSGGRGRNQTPNCRHPGNVEMQSNLQPETYRIVTILEPI